MYVLDFSRSEVPRVDLDDDLARLRINSLFVNAGASPPSAGHVRQTYGTCEEVLRT